MHDEMGKRCPYIVIDVDGIDGVKFDFNKLLRFILEMFKLDEIARTTGGVKIAITLDGADLSQHIQHVTCRIKVVNP